MREPFNNAVHFRLSSGDKERARRNTGGPVLNDVAVKRLGVPRHDRIAALCLLNVDGIAQRSGCDGDALLGYLSYRVSAFLQCTVKDRVVMGGGTFNVMAIRKRTSEITRQVEAGESV